MLNFGAALQRQASSHLNLPPGRCCNERWSERRGTPGRSLYEVEKEQADRRGESTDDSRLVSRRSETDRRSAIGQEEGSNNTTDSEKPRRYDDLSEYEQ